MLFADRVARLEQGLGTLPGLVVALSGGVDSAALLGVAARVLPGRVVGATTRSLAVPDEEVAAAAAVAASLGVPHVVARTGELADPAYRANRGDRCYHCRRFMYDALAAVARAAGIGFVADGLHADDRVADRPGVAAARERGILHPLRDVGLTKAEVRRLALGLGLGSDVHDKPSQPCLASRVAVGLEVTTSRLAQVHRAERAIRAMGFAVLRVRHEGLHGRVEVGAAEHARARARARSITAAVRAAGFVSASVDPRPYGGGASREDPAPVRDAPVSEALGGRAPDAGGRGR